MRLLEALVASPEVSAKLEDVLAYLQCPLKARYLSWGAKMAPKTTKDRVIRSVEKAVGVFLMKMSMDPRSGFTAGNNAAKFLEKDIFPDGQRDVKDAGQILYGLDIMKRFARHFDWDKDRAICGPLPSMPVVVDNVEVIGNLTGVVARDYGTEKEVFCVVHVSRGEKPRPTWERVLEGFQHFAVRQAVGTEGRRKIVKVVRLDPYAMSVHQVEMTGRDHAIFEALLPAAVRGLASGIAVPHQSALNCGRCPFDGACSPRFARMNISRFLKKEFFDAYSHA